MFGNVNYDLLNHLEFALAGVRGERGHKLEPAHTNPQLVQAEDHIVQAIRLLDVYRTKGGK